MLMTLKETPEMLQSIELIKPEFLVTFDDFSDEAG
jgi:hypothetical protein